MCRSPRGYPPPVFEAGLEAALVNAPNLAARGCATAVPSSRTQCEGTNGGRLRTRIPHVAVPVAFQAVEVPDLLTYLSGGAPSFPPSQGASTEPDSPYLDGSARGLGCAIVAESRSARCPCLAAPDGFKPSPAPWLVDSPNKWGPHACRMGPRQRTHPPSGQVVVSG